MKSTIQHEWKSHRPSPALVLTLAPLERAVINSKLAAAGAQYAELFKAFSSTSLALRAAPSPLDVYNCMYLRHHGHGHEK